MILVLIAAVGDNGVIGRDGDMPWRIRSDLKQFRAATLGKPLIMGRKTYRSLGRPLDKRTNIVVTRDRNFAAPGVIAVPDLDRALAVAKGDALRRGVGEIAVIGGGELYAQLMPRADRLLISRVHLSPAGDATFPPIPAQAWREVSRTPHPAGPGDDASFTVTVYERAV